MHLKILIFRHPCEFDHAGTGNHQLFMVVFADNVVKLDTGRTDEFRFIDGIGNWPGIICDIINRINKIGMIGAMADKKGFQRRCA